VTAFTVGAEQLQTEPAAQPGVDRSALMLVDVVWAGFVVAMLLVMWQTRHGMTIPYHFIFVTFALVYGFRLWPARAAISILVGLTAVTGLVFGAALLNGEVSWDEMAEIPLMPLIVAFMVWHALRGAAARREVEQLAALEAGRLDRQREFLRDTSHAIRTPVTIARGHVQLLTASVTDPEHVQDADEILHQLDRLNGLAGRLLSIEQLQTAPATSYEPVDIQSCVSVSSRRWATAVHRRWVLDIRPAGVAATDEHRLVEALDALVENALRFTGENDVVRLSTYADGSWAVIEVADSGPGVPHEDRQRIFERFFHRHPRGEEPGTGLGLALVHAVATTHGGSVVVVDAPEGGALFRLRLPTQSGGVPVNAR
jgi:signal transduction histidine kinase